MVKCNSSKLATAITWQGIETFRLIRLGNDQVPARTATANDPQRLRSIRLGGHRTDGNMPMVATMRATRDRNGNSRTICPGWCCHNSPPSPSRSAAISRSRAAVERMRPGRRPGPDVERSNAMDADSRVRHETGIERSAASEVSPGRKASSSGGVLISHPQPLESFVSQTAAGSPLSGQSDQSSVVQGLHALPCADPLGF